MENKSALRILMDNLKKILPFLILSLPIYAQEAKPGIIKISDLQSAYVDRPGDLYILQKNGTLKKFDIGNNIVNDIPFPSIPIAFDPRDGARMFVCFKSTCSYFSAETRQEFDIEPQYAIDPQLMCSSGDHNFWILDRSDVSIKRIDPKQSKVIADTPIDQKQFTMTPEFTFMREYQNFLFIIEKNSGILIFNSLGKQIKKIPITQVEHLGFLGEELYYKKKDKLYFYDLFDASTREMPIDARCRYAFLTDTRKYLVYENRIEIFEIH